MLSLTKIFLHNWHRFNHHVIDVEDSLYLAGHNGSGKSSVLDALQMVLVADLHRIRFNSSAQDRSARSLDSYVRGKVGESRWLRPGNTVAYIALEFSDKHTAKQTTLGVCIEAGEGRTPDRTYFILPEPLDPGLFVVEGRPVPRRELKQMMMTSRHRRGIRTYDQVSEYQAELLNRLGGLHERFMDLFLRALTFQPIRNIREFVEQWLLTPHSLDVETLQKVVDRLGTLSSSAQEVENKLAALQAITARQAEIRRLQDLNNQYIVLAALLQVVQAQSRIDAYEERCANLQQQVRRGQADLAELKLAVQGSQDALLEAQLRLRESDVVRRRDELQHRIDDLQAEVNARQRQWQNIRRELQQEAETLRPLLGAPGLEKTVTDSLRSLLDHIAALTPQTSAIPELATRLDSAIPALEASLTRVQENSFRLRQEIETLRARGKVLEQELAQLRGSKNRITYPPATERLRDLLTPVVGGTRPPLLCELLEIPDERWQNAVEALLGQRRFTIIVQPGYFDAGLRVLDEARAREALYDAGLLDIERIKNDARPAQPASLALQVTVALPALRPYIDTVLGDIITCDHAGQLRKYRRSVTPEVVVYGEWTARAIPPARYTPWFVGQRAQHSQIEVREKELDGIGNRLAELAPAATQVDGQVNRLKRWHQLAQLRQRMDAPLDDRPLQDLISELDAELKSLDLSGITGLEQEVQRLNALLSGQREGERQRLTQVVGWETELRSQQGELVVARRELAEREQQATEMRARYPEVVATVENLLTQRIQGAMREIPAATLSEDSEKPGLDLGDAIRNTEIAARNFETRAMNELRQLAQEATTYNTLYQFAARAADPAEGRYAQEAERLGGTELPQYKQQIAQARSEAEEELREHVLHRLREQILGARQELERLNDTLTRHEFHGERYRFRYQPAEEVREFYDLINDAQLLGAGSLFESQFYQDHKTTFDRFYELLTRAPRSESERLEQEQLTDYRRYLHYDIEVTHPDGRTSRLSRIMDQTSGGETQTPFYLAIATSFVQLYRIDERSSRSTIRLVVFDEAFSKMDQDRIGSTLDLFQRFNLQVITATPLERCEYLVPKVCTSLVLTTAGDTVLVEPYRNYAARLETADPLGQTYAG
ncbi:MAG: AAA family ATPase [Chloroflexi bacterium]|nr:AAA family ATPase [Chloroflexota bacterium]